MPLSDKEFLLLVENFKSEKENSVRWRDICDAIDEVFRTKNLEKISATQKIESVSIEYFYGKRDLTQEEIDIVN